MAGHATEVREAKEPEKRSYRKIHHIEIEKVKGENGGHIVRHHYHADGMSYHEPSTHIFGKGDGEEMMTHIAKHMGVEMPGREQEPEEEVAEQPAEQEPEEA